MSKTPNWLLDAALTGAHWLWRNKWLVALLAATGLLVGVLVYRTVALPMPEKWNAS